MVDAVIRGIVREVRVVLEENPLPFVINVLKRSNDRALKCMRHDALLGRFKCLVNYLPVKTTLRMYNAGKFSASLEVLKIVCTAIEKTPHRSSRDAAALREEIASLGKCKIMNFLRNSRTLART